MSYHFYTLSDLIEKKELEEVINRFATMNNISITITNNDNTIFVQSNWTKICEIFHRKDNQNYERCRISEIIHSKRIKECIEKGEGVEHLQCWSGLYHSGYPIILEGQNIGTIFISQYYFRKFKKDPNLEDKLKETYTIFSFSDLGISWEKYKESFSSIRYFEKKEIYVINEMIGYIESFVKLLISMTGRYKSILDNMREYVYSSKYYQGNPTPIESFNSMNCKKITGYSISDFNNDIWLWLKMIYYLDIDRVLQQITSSETEAKVSDKNISKGVIEHRIITKTKELKWIRNSYIIYHLYGNVYKREGFILDITNEHYEKERIDFTMDSLDVYIYSSEIKRLPEEIYESVYDEDIEPKLEREQKELFHNYYKISDSIPKVIYYLNDKIEIESKLEKMDGGKENISLFKECYFHKREYKKYILRDELSEDKKSDINNILIEAGINNIHYILDPNLNRLSQEADNLKSIFRTIDYAEQISMAYHSSQCKNITGYSPNDYKDNKYLWETMIYKKDKNRVKINLMDAEIECERKMIPIQVNNIHRIICKGDNKIKWISNKCTFIKNYEEDNIRIVGFIVDITKNQEYLENEFSSTYHFKVQADSTDNIHNNRNFNYSVFSGYTNEELENPNTFNIMFDTIKLIEIEEKFRSVKAEIINNPNVHKNFSKQYEIYGAKKNIILLENRCNIVYKNGKDIYFTGEIINSEANPFINIQNPYFILSNSKHEQKDPFNYLYCNYTKFLGKILINFGQEYFNEFIKRCILLLRTAFEVRYINIVKTSDFKAKEYIKESIDKVLDLEKENHHTPIKYHGITFIPDDLSLKYKQLTIFIIALIISEIIILLYRYSYNDQDKYLKIDILINENILSINIIENGNGLNEDYLELIKYLCKDIGAVLNIRGKEIRDVNSGPIVISLKKY
jgi:ligand-binding sensor protein